MTNIRYAKPTDAEELLKIYAYYVRETAITFEYEVPSVDEFRSRIEHIQERFPYLVAEKDGKIAGYSYAKLFHERAAYSHCAETSIYLDKDARYLGIGKALYETLEKKLKEQGFLNLYACIAWIDTPNEYLTHQSPKFHTKMGYTKVAHLHKCGYKFNKWFDIIWMEKRLELSEQ